MSLKTFRNSNICSYKCIPPLCSIKPYGRTVSSPVHTH